MEQATSHRRHGSVDPISRNTIRNDNKVLSKIDFRDHGNYHGSRNPSTKTTVV
jgi:hypothetical protein